jgi:hypothetical protein
MELYYILYTSTPVKKLNDEELTELLQIAREANVRFEVTGILVCLSESYIQLIEGPEQCIKQLYENIKHDKRHWQVTALHKGPINSRFFPDWAMAFEKQDSTTADQGSVSTIDEKVLRLFGIMES